MSVNEGLTRTIEYSTVRCHHLGLALPFPVLFAQKKAFRSTAWLQQCHHRRANQLCSGSRGNDLPFHNLGQEIWIEGRGSSGTV